jgi:glycosyltransferase involved in cell wall biosynthesis
MPHTMDKILFLTKSREFGGLEVVLLDWLSQIDYAKVSVALCCYGTDALWKRLANRGFPVEIIPLTVSDSEPVWKTFPQWVRLFRTVRPSKIVFVEGNLGELGVAPIAATPRSISDGVYLFAGGGGGGGIADRGGQLRKLHFGILPGIGLHRLPESVKQRARGIRLRRIFVSSEGMRRILVEQFGYSAERTAALYHGVDTERFKASASERLKVRRACGVPDEALVIVSHGRPARIKRFDRILRAFEVLAPEYENLWLLLTCYGPQREEVGKIVAESHKFRRVRLVGFQEDPSELLKAADIYILASDSEGFGIALVEAMSSGLVCVATNCVGPASILIDDVNGVLVPATDEGVLAGLRKAVGLSAEDRSRLVARARQTVEDRFEIRAAIRRALAAMEIPERQLESLVD